MARISPVSCSGFYPNLRAIQISCPFFCSFIVQFFIAFVSLITSPWFKEELTAERRRRWISAISREDLTDSILENDRDCSKHFVSEEPAKDWYRFNVDWPTLSLGHSKHCKQQVQVKDPAEQAKVRS